MSTLVIALDGGRTGRRIISVFGTKIGMEAVEKAKRCGKCRLKRERIGQREEEEEVHAINDLAVLFDYAFLPGPGCRQGCD